MKKSIIGFSVLAFAALAGAWTPGVWNYAGGAHVKEVRQNGRGFWFQIETSNSTDAVKWFGAHDTVVNYKVMVSLVLTAKATNRTINFLVSDSAQQYLNLPFTDVISIRGVSIL